jgi:hypothetical protein
MTASDLDYAGPAGDPREQWQQMVQAELELSARLCAATERVADLMQSRQDQTDLLARSVNWVPAPSIPLNALPVVQSNAGPEAAPAPLAFCWAVQRVTVGPIGATSDAVTLYKGRSKADVLSVNALHTFTGAAGTYADWEPGRTGCILKPNESIIAAGTITGANPVLSWDVLIIDQDALPLFLL